MTKCRTDWFLVVILGVAFIVRMLSPSPRGQAGWDNSRSDAACLLVWSRNLSEATHLNLSRGVVSSALRGDTESVARALAQDKDDLLFGVLWGLYYRPEKVTHVVDVMLLSSWFRLWSYGILTAEHLMIFFSLGTILVAYYLTVKTTDDKRMARIAAVIVALLPSMVHTSRWVSWHIFGQLTFALTILVGFIAADHLEKPRATFYQVLLGVMWAVALYCNIVFPCFGPVVLLPVFLGAGSTKGAVWQGCVAWVRSVLIGIALFMPAVLFVAFRWRTLLARLREPAKDYYGAVSLSSKLSYFVDSQVRICTLLVFVLALIGIGYCLFRRDRRAYAFLVWIVSYVAFVSIQFSHSVSTRWGLHIAVPMVILASMAVVYLYDSFMRRVRSAWSVAGEKSQTYRAVRAAVVAVIGAIAVGVFVTNGTKNWALFLPSEGHYDALEQTLVQLDKRLASKATIVTDYENEIQALLADRKEWTIIGVASLLQRSGQGDVREYLAWRYGCALSFPGSVVAILGSPSPRKVSEDQRVLEIIRAVFGPKLKGPVSLESGTVRVYGLPSR